MNNNILINIEDCIKNDCYNFLSPHGLGDTFMLCSFHKEWEKRNNGKIHFIIKPTHKVIMEMFGIKNYSVYDFNRYNNRKDFLCGNNININLISNEPTVGKIFIAHPHFLTGYENFIEKFSNDYPFENFYKLFLNIPLNSVMKKPKQINCLGSLKKKFGLKKDLSKIILFLPEAYSLNIPSSDYFMDIYEKSDKNYVFQYVKDKINLLSNIPYIDLSIEEIINLSSICKLVVSNRSGICDLISMFVKKAIVYYPSFDPNIKTRFSLCRIFNRNTDDIEEIIIQKQEPLVSIITPTLNIIDAGRKEFLKQTIDSVVNQTYKNIEYIVKDGGSTDGTVEFLKEYEQKGLLKLVVKKDTGIYQAWNQGIEISNGKIIAIISSDDYYDSPNVVENVVKYIQQERADYAYGIERGIDYKTNKQIYLWTENKYDKNDWWKRLIYPPEATFFRKSIWQDIGGFDENYKIISDFKFHYHLVLNDYRSVYVPEIIENFRVGCGISSDRSTNGYANYENYLLKFEFWSKFYPTLTMQDVFEMTRKDKFKNDFLISLFFYVVKTIRKNFDYRSFYEYISDNCDSNKIIRIRLFNLLSLIKIKLKHNRKKYYLFDFIPLFSVKVK